MCVGRGRDGCLMRVGGCLVYGGRREWLPRECGRRDGCLMGVEGGIAPHTFSHSVLLVRVQ